MRGPVRLSRIMSAASCCKESSFSFIFFLSPLKIFWALEKCANENTATSRRIMFLENIFREKALSIRRSYDAINGKMVVKVYSARHHFEECRKSLKFYKALAKFSRSSKAR